MSTATQIQQEREAAYIANHRERLQWLEAPDPVWSCGTRVDAYTRRVLLNQSRAAIAEHDLLTNPSRKL